MEVTPSETKPFNPLDKWLNLNQNKWVWDNFKSTWKLFRLIAGREGYLKIKLIGLKFSSQNFAKQKKRLFYSW